ncbi:hypothetical protein B0J14DRAFT_653855 [Halenospora varia]|nr:hypothetical protein B0J14DRAFT_653855 [Halenospora varia]
MSRSITRTVTKSVDPTTAPDSLEGLSSQSSDQSSHTFIGIPTLLIPDFLTGTTSSESTTVSLSMLSAPTTVSKAASGSSTSIEATSTISTPAGRISSSSPANALSGSPYDNQGSDKRLPGELPIGAITGIVVGVVIIVAIAILQALICIRRREPESNKDIVVNNDHGIAELQSKDNMHDIDSTSTHHARNSIEANKYVSQLLSAMAELPANPVTEKQNSSGSTFSSAMVTAADTTASTQEQSNDKLDILRAKINKIRADKERLTKPQEMDELEATV